MSPKSLIPVLLIPFTITACDLTGCNGDDSDAPPPRQAEESDELPHHDHTELADIVDLTVPGEHPDRQLTVGTTDHYSACHELLEPDGEPGDWPYSTDEVERALFGCNGEGAVALTDGRFVVAYEVPLDEQFRATNLRLVLYGDDGSIQWHRTLDRSWRADNFAARYRGSFITNVGDELVCTGTRWIRDSQLLCVRTDSGSVAWDGRLNLEPGTGLFGFDGSLLGADETGITRRYPYSGTEMRHRAFETRGGVTSYLANDGERIFYGPGEDHAYVEAWELESLQRIWSADLPDAPHHGFERVDAGLGLALMLIDETLVGLDTETGELRAALHVGDTPPKVAFSPENLFVMLRADDRPLIYAIDPDDGAVDWVADAPPATRDITYIDGHLTTRSVRTVRTLVY